MQEFAKQVLDYIVKASERLNYAIAVAVSPYQALRLSDAKMNGVTFCWNLARPDPNQVVKAFATTSEVLGGPPLGYHQQQWLSLIARAQNWPGPVSTMAARIIYIPAQAPNPGVSTIVRRVYPKDTQLDSEIEKAWRDVIVAHTSDQNMYRKSVGALTTMSEQEFWRLFGEPLTVRQTMGGHRMGPRVPRIERAPVALIAAYPGSGRLAFAQLLFRTLLRGTTPRAMKPDTFQLIDMSCRSPTSNVTRNDLDSIDACLAQAGAFVYIDLSEPAPGAINNDLLDLQDTKYSSLDILLFGRDQPKVNWIPQSDAPSMATLRPDSDKQRAQEVIREFFPADISWNLTDWDVPNFGLMMGFEGVSLVVSKEKERIDAFVRRLAMRTGRGLLRLSSDELSGDPLSAILQRQYLDGSLELRPEPQWRQTVRDFALTHRHGIVWIDDVLKCPSEWLSMSTDYGHSRLGASVNDLGRLDDLRIISRTDSWDWAPGGRRPCIDWQSIERMWVIGAIQIPADFPDHAIVLRQGRIMSRRAFADAFTEPTRDRVSWLMSRWSEAYYIPAVLPEPQT